MVHFTTVAATTLASVVLSSLAPGAQAAPAMPPLPMRQEARRSMLNSGDMDLEKRDLKIKGGFDPDHSLHWNYHHNLASEDGHGHGWHGAKERRTIDLEAIIQLNAKSQKQDKRSLLGLNLGGNNGLLGSKNKKGLLGSEGGLGLNLRKEKRGDHVHIHSHGLSDKELRKIVGKLDDHSHVHIHAHKEKRSVEADDEDLDDEEYDDELEKRSPEPRSSRSRHRHRHRHDRYDSHDHVHVHSHKRDEISTNEELEKRSSSQPKRFERKSKKSKGKKSSSKSAKSFKKKDSKKNDTKKSKSKGASNKKDNKKAATSSSSESKPAVSAKVSLGKRALEQAGVPGFVEVATPLFNSSLARTVAGLVFTANPDPSPNATTFVLGTSDAESTQFYLTTASNPDPSTPAELNVVNIRVPILDSQTLKVVNYCATFDLTPPSPLSLLPCGKKDGFSQNFAYNGTTGEIQPLYSTTPAPMALVSNKASQAASDARSFAATDSNSTASAQPEEDPEDISLYFIPSANFYEAPNDVNHLIDSHKNRTLAAASSTTDDEMSSATSTMDSEPTSTDLPISTDSSSAPDATMTSAPMDDGSSGTTDDYSTMESSSMMDGAQMDDASMTQDSMDPMATPTDFMMTDDSMATPTDSMMSDDSMATPTDSESMDEPLSTSTVEPTPSSTPNVNQNNAASPSSSSMMASGSSSSSSSMATPSSAPLSSSMTPSGTPSGSMSSASSTSSSASATPTVTIQSSDYTTPGMNSDPNSGIDANASNYSPMKLRRRRSFARW